MTTKISTKEKLMLAAKATLIATLFVGLFTTIEFSLAKQVVQNEVKKDAANVAQQQCVYIFAFCKPGGNYDYLGSIKTTLVLADPTPSNRIKFALKKLKNDFPTANGLQICEVAKLRWLRGWLCNFSNVLLSVRCGLFC